jgi:hypothetical protein
MLYDENRLDIIDIQSELFDPFFSPHSFSALSYVTTTSMHFIYSQHNNIIRFIYASRSFKSSQPTPGTAATQSTMMVDLMPHFLCARFPPWKSHQSLFLAVSLSYSHSGFVSIHTLFMHYPIHTLCLSLNS